MEAFKQILELLRQKFPIWASVALACALFLFLPDGIAKRLLFLELRQSIGGYVGIVLLITISLMAVDLVTKLIHGRSERKRLRQKQESALEAQVNEIAKKRELERQRENSLHRLSVTERQILCGYILTGEKTQYLSILDGNVAGLCKAGIIFQSSPMGTLLGKGFAFNIHDWAWEYLRRNQHLIIEGVPRDQLGRIILYQNPDNLFDP